MLRLLCCAFLPQGWVFSRFWGAMGGYICRSKVVSSTYYYDMLGAQTVH